MVDVLLPLFGGFLLASAAREFFPNIRLFHPKSINIKAVLVLIGAICITVGIAMR